MRKKIVLLLTIILLLLSIVPVSAEELSDSYFAQYGFEQDEIIAHSSFDFISLKDMYLTYQEYPIGNLIADSYIYETRKNGINDIDLALVSLETIKGTFTKGNITAKDVFDICSLEEESNGTTEQTLICIYVTGKELRFLVESDASLGSMTPELKMSYSGLRYSYNEKRIPMDKVVDIKLHDEFGIKTDSIIEDDKLYKICCNVYTANVLQRLNELTKGVISIIPKNADGSIVGDLHECEISTLEGLEIKEWYAIADYLQSLEEVPRVYEKIQGRKQKLQLNGIVSIFGDPGLATYIAFGLVILAVVVLFLLIKLIKALLEAFFKEGKHSKSRHD